MRSWRRLLACALATCIGASAASAAAPRTARADEPTAANVAAARRHYERARDYYGQGAYREAIGELELARALDPTAKDLVFNLGVVHEKLADIDDALKWFRLFTTMSLTAQERERADAYIRRLEGAKRELDEKPPPPPLPPVPTIPTAVPLPPPPPVVDHPTMGRVDALTVSAAGVAVAGLTFGIVLGALAERDKPSSTFVTGRNGTYADLADAQARAHREAVMADIGFGVAAVTAVAAAVLFFARPRASDATRAASPKPSAGDPDGGSRAAGASDRVAGTSSVSAVPIAGGAAFVVQGSF
jgi:hypothetical protein